MKNVHRAIGNFDAHQFKLVTYLISVMYRKPSIFLAGFYSIVIFLIPMFYVVGDAEARQHDGTFTLEYRNITLDESLRRLSNMAGINIVYDAALTGTFRVNGRSVDKTPAGILDDLLRGTNLGYRVSEDGSFILFAIGNGNNEFAILRGIVLNNSDRSALENVNIKINRQNRGTASGADGSYRINRLEPGRYRVTFTHVGFEPLSRIIRLEAGETAELNIRMNPQLIPSDQVIIMDGRNPLIYLIAGMDFIEPGNLDYITGFGTPDALRNLNYITGVQFQSPMADFSIQGSYTGAHQVRLEGTPIFSPVSMGRFISAFSPYAIRQITVHKAGFRASEGSGTAGVVAAGQDLPLYDERRFLVQVDPIGTNTRITHIANMFDHRVEFMAAGRFNMPWTSQYMGIRSLIRDWNVADPVLARRYTGGGLIQNWPESWQQDESINFYDLHFSTRIRNPELDPTVINFYFGGNDFETGLATQPVNNQQLRFRDSYRWYNRMFSIYYQRNFTDRSRTRFYARLSKHLFDHDYGAFNQNVQTGVISSTVFNEITSNTATYLAMGVRYDYEFSQELSVDAGFEFGYSDVSLRLSDFFKRAVRVDNTQLSTTFFADFTYHIDEHYRLIGGNRLTWVFTRSIYPEPRIALGGQFMGTSYGNIAFLLSAGLFRDFIQQLELTNPAPNATVPAVRFWLPVLYTDDIPLSWHLSLDTRIEPVRGYIFRFEPYLKLLSNASVVDYAGFSSGTNTSLTVPAKGYATGVGLSANRLFPKGEASILYNFNITRHRTPSRFDNKLHQPHWAEPHQLILAGGWMFAENWRVSLQWETRFGGRNWAYRQAFYDYVYYEGFNVPVDLGKPERHRKPFFHQADAGISWSKVTNKIDLIVRLEIINLYNQKNFLDRGFLPSSDAPGGFKNVDRRYSNFQPILSIQASF